MQSIANSILAGNSDNLFALLDEVPEGLNIKASELAEILRLAMSVEQLKRSLATSEEEANSAFKLWGSAKRILDDPRFGKNRAARYSRALYELGLVREEKGKGRSDPKFRRAADLYYLLRTGGHTHENGRWVEVKPCSHEEAVQAVMHRFEINEWRTLERAWERIEKKTGQSVKPSYDAEVYPVK